MTQENNKRLAEAYERLSERTMETLKDLGNKTAPILQHALDAAKTKAVELGELTAEEAAQVAEYVRRDLHDAGEYLAEHEREFADGLRLDALLIEERLLKRVSSLADVARQETKHAVRTPAHPLEWHTGEVTGIGTLACKSCGKEIHFYKAGHIPPCQQCHGSKFQRAWHS